MDGQKRNSKLVYEQSKLVIFPEFSCIFSRKFLIMNFRWKMSSSDGKGICLHKKINQKINLHTDSTLTVLAFLAVAEFFTEAVT